MSTLNAIVSKLVLEDLETGTGTVQVPTSNGGTRLGTQINASGIPLTDATATLIGKSNVDAAIAALKAGTVPIAHIGAGGTAHANATTGVAGFMSAADKSKLDGVVAGATNTPLSSTAPSPLAASASVGTSTTAARADHAHQFPTAAQVGAADAAHVGSGGATHAVAVANGAAGFLSGSDKAKLDGIQSSAINQTTADGRYEQVSKKGAVNGYASLGSDGKIPSSQLPAIAITDTFVVNTQAAMLALVAETGDVAMRTDLSKSFILKAEPASTLANWQELLTPAAPVQSVNGKTGSVSLTTSDISQGANLYYTDTLADARVQNAKAITVPSANGAASVGTATTWARADHVHPMPSASDVGAAPSSHVGSGGGAHAAVVANGASGFMSGSDKAKLDGIAASATNTPLSSSAPSALGSAAAAGTSSQAARADHTHPYPTAAQIGAASAAGSSAQDFSAKDLTVTKILNESSVKPALSNGWVQLDGEGTSGNFSDVRYWKDKNGVVHITGLCKNGNWFDQTGNGLVFVLPVGYRPAFTEVFLTYGYNGGTGLRGFARVDVGATGNVVAHSGGTNGNSQLSLAGISFKAEN